MPKREPVCRGTGERGRNSIPATAPTRLLMNIFCYPGVAGSAAVASLLGIEPSQNPEFGFKARVPLKSGQADRTEVDMRLGDLLVEAKLTESNFQSKDVSVVQGYRDFQKVFDARLLEKAGSKFLVVSTDPQCLGCVCQRLCLLCPAGCSTARSAGELAQRDASSAAGWTCDCAAKY